MHPLREELAFEWGILNTYDMLSPKYDKPQTRREIMRWFALAGLTEVTVQYGPMGLLQGVELRFGHELGQEERG